MADSLNTVITELETGMAREQCRQCGCMRGALQDIRAALSGLQSEKESLLRSTIESLLAKTEETAYS